MACNPQPQAVCIEWTEPLMAAGNWVPELVQLAGGTSRFGTVGQHSPWISWDDLVAADPDKIVIMPCGYDLAVTRRETQPLIQHPAWASLKAVQQGQVYLVDGNQYFNRPGPRLVESLEILAEIFHPQGFAPHHRGQGWDYLTPLTRGVYFLRKLRLGGEERRILPMMGNSMVGVLTNPKVRLGRSAISS